MKKELEDKLFAKYPEIFKDKDGDPKNTLLCFGLDVGDGWYFLIDQLCKSLSWTAHDLRKRIADMKNMLAQEDKSKWDGWQHAYYNVERLAELETKLNKELEKIPVAIQVKEKFGGLRFYVSGATEEQYTKIQFAESLSHRICEECGTMQDAMTYRMTWHSTLCPTHADDRYGESIAQAYRDQINEISLT